MSPRAFESKGNQSGGVVAWLEDVHYRWFGIIPNGIKMAAMWDDVHYRWFGIIPNGIKWQPCWMMFTIGGLQSFLREYK